MRRLDGKKSSCEARDRGFESSHDRACAFTRASRKVYSFSGWVVPLVATGTNRSFSSSVHWNEVHSVLDKWSVHLTKELNIYTIQSNFSYLIYVLMSYQYV